MLKRFHLGFAKSPLRGGGLWKKRGRLAAPKQSPQDYFIISLCTSFGPHFERIKPPNQIGPFFLTSCAGYRSLHMVELRRIVVPSGQNYFAFKLGRNSCEDVDVVWKGIGNEAEFWPLPCPQTGCSSNAQTTTGMFVACCLYL